MKQFVEFLDNMMDCVFFLDIIDDVGPWQHRV